MPPPKEFLTLYMVIAKDFKLPVTIIIQKESKSSDELLIMEKRVYVKMKSPMVGQERPCYRSLKSSRERSVN